MTLVHRRSLQCVLPLSLALCAASAAQAAVTAHTRQDSFLAAAGAAQTDTFDNLNDADNTPVGGTTLGVIRLAGDITVGLAGAASDLNNSTHLRINTSYGGWADLHFNQPVMAFGAWFKGLGGFSTLMVEADSLQGYGSYQHLADFSPSAAVGGGVQFVGFTSDVAFNRIVFNGAGCCSSRFSMDDVSFSSALAVPEPASGALLLTGATGLAGWARRRRPG